MTQCQIILKITSLYTKGRNLYWMSMTVKSKRMTRQQAPPVALNDKRTTKLILQSEFQRRRWKKQQYATYALIKGKSAILKIMPCLLDTAPVLYTK